MGFGGRATSHSDTAWDLGAGRQATVRGHGIWEQSEKPQTEGVGLGSEGTSHSGWAWD